MAAFFTELFRVEPANVESLFDPQLERGNDSSLWLRNLGDLELVGLWNALPNSDPDATMLGNVVAAGPALAFSLPEDFVNSIHELTDDSIQTVAQNWRKMDELASCPVADLAEAICNVRTLVRDARRDQQIVVQLAEM